MRAEIQEDVQILELPGRPLHDELLQRGHAEIHPRLGQRVWRQQRNSKDDAGAEASRAELAASLTSSSQYRRITSRADSVMMGASRTSLVKSLMGERQGRGFDLNKN